MKAQNIGRYYICKADEGKIVVFGKIKGTTIIVPKKEIDKVKEIEIRPVK